MGIPTPDPATPYGDDCALCFAAGLTPSYVYVLIAGVKQAPSLPDPIFRPPNGAYLLKQNNVNPCNWFFEDLDAWSVSYSIVPGAPILFSDKAPAINGFTSVGTATCQTGFVSQNAPDFPPALYTGGAAQVFHLPQPGAASIHKIFDLLNIDHSANNLCEMFYGSPTKADLRYAKKDRSDSLIIQFDPTA